jgi:hypothetical protein
VKKKSWAGRKTVDNQSTTSIWRDLLNLHCTSVHIAKAYWQFLWEISYRCQCGILADKHLPIAQPGCLIHLHVSSICFKGRGVLKARWYWVVVLVNAWDLVQFRARIVLHLCEKEDEPVGIKVKRWCIQVPSWRRGIFTSQGLVNRYLAQTHSIRRNSKLRDGAILGPEWIVLGRSVSKTWVKVSSSLGRNVLAEVLLGRSAWHSWVIRNSFHENLTRSVKPTIKLWSKSYKICHLATKRVTQRFLSGKD